MLRYDRKVRSAPSGISAQFERNLQRFMLYEFLKDNYKEAEPIFFSDIVIKGNRAFSESGG